MLNWAILQIATQKGATWNKTFQVVKMDLIEFEPTTPTIRM